MTGLSMTTAEILQVQNYGIGGHYNPHWDFEVKRQSGNLLKALNKGNRIATVLVYVRLFIIDC